MATHKKICLVTGANSGIGKQAAIQIAQEGHRVVMACRSQQRGEAALAEVKEASGSEDVELLLVDLSLQSSIREACARFLEGHDRLDVLVHNAAWFDISKKQRLSTDEGIELVWATNHLGPVLMTDLLLPALRASEQGRILFISSKGLVVYPNLKVDLEDPEFEGRKYSVQRAYYQSKLAQVAWMLHLAQELEDTPITVHGIRVTNVQLDTSRYPDMPRFLLWIYSIKLRFAITAAEMARTYTWLATAPAGGLSTGGYWDSIDKPTTPSRYAADEAHRAAIVELTRRYLPAPA